MPRSFAPRSRTACIAEQRTGANVPAHQLPIPAWWCGLILVLVPGIGQANVGPLTSGGQVVAEPAGIDHISISRESLLLDLRPLAGNQPGEVLAIYHLENRGPERRLDLLFASGGPDLTGFEATLDDHPLPSQPRPDVAIPSDWQPPGTTPPLRSEAPLSYLGYGSRKTVPVAMSATVPPGTHTLRVRYRAAAALHRLGQPTVYHQFAYILAPARTWAGFGGLDVTVQLPPNWKVACEPELSRAGDVLSGSFATIPQDAIALTIQAPEGPYHRTATRAGLFTCLLTPVLGLFGCRLAGRYLGRTISNADSARRPRFWPRSLFTGGLTGLLTFAVGLGAVFGPDLLLPPGQINYFGYGRILYLIGIVYLSLLAAFAGFILAVTTARRIWNKRTSISGAPPQIEVG